MKESRLPVDAAAPPVQHQKIQAARGEEELMRGVYDFLAPKSQMWRVTLSSGESSQYQSLILMPCVASSRLSKAPVVSFLTSEVRRLASRAKESGIAACCAGKGTEGWLARR